MDKRKLTQSVKVVYNLHTSFLNMCLAQLVEHLAYTEKVSGSNPLAPT